MVEAVDSGLVNVCMTNKTNLAKTLIHYEPS